MKGKHKIEVRSGRVVFTIELERNITILRGDSATGKTTLVEMLQAYECFLLGIHTVRKVCGGYQPATAGF